MPQNANNNIPLKTRQIIANEYDATAKVLNSQIEHYQLNIPHNVLLFPKQQKMIYETLGYPNCVDPNDYKNV
jgi:hypothetical protein